MSKTNLTVTGNNNFTAGGDINIEITASQHYAFSPQVMAEIINALYENIQQTPTELDDFALIDLSQKNQLNGIDQDFFDNVIKTYYAHFAAFDKFFKNIRNKNITEKYKCILPEIQGRIFSDVRNGKKLQDILPVLFDYAKINHQALFAKNGYLLNLLAYYMYTRCDIGIKEWLNQINLPIPLIG